jgi:hypothetical protein
VRAPIILTVTLAACSQKLPCRLVSEQADTWARNIPPYSWVHPTVPLAIRAGGDISAANQGAPLVEIDERGLRLEGKPIWHPGDPTDAIAEAVRARLVDEEVIALDPDRVPDPSVLVAIARDTPWKVVAPALDGLAPSDGTISVVFVFQRPEPPHTKRPPPSRVDAALARVEKLPADQQAAALAELVEKATGTCGSLKQLFSAAAAISPGQRDNFIKTGFGGALKDCGCSCDFDSLRVLLWKVLVPEIAVGFSRLEIANPSDPTEEIRTISLPADTTWSAAAATLAEGYGSAFLAVAGDPTTQPATSLPAQALGDSGVMSSDVVLANHASAHKVKKLLPDLGNILGGCLGDGEVLELTFCVDDGLDVRFHVGGDKAFKCLRDMVPPSPFGGEAPRHCAWAAFSKGKAPFPAPPDRKADLKLLCDSPRLSGAEHEQDDASRADKIVAWWETHLRHPDSAAFVYTDEADELRSALDAEGIDVATCAFLK